MSNNIGIIILAAGASRRMGQPKQLLKWQGKSLIQHVCKLALSTDCSPVILVLGANADVIRAGLATRGMNIVVNADWQLGMGGSLKAGINKLVEINPAVDAAIILLVDQPLVDNHHIQKLLESYEATDKKIIASAYNQTLGVPALIDRGYFKKLQTIRADQGARVLIQKEIESVASIPFPVGALDLDRPEDWERFKEKYG